MEQLKNVKIMALLLAAATFVLFAPALGYDFINYDDGLYVYDNPNVLGGFSFSSLAYAFTTTDGGSWMPLTWLSYLLDVTVFGARPVGFHLTNICLHAASVVCLFLALRRMTGSLWRSAFVAAIFAWHPLRAESVVWIAERKDVLSALCWMLGLLAYAGKAESGKQKAEIVGGSPSSIFHLPSSRRYWLVGLCFTLGLMAKPMVVTFPFVLLLLDFWPLGRMGKSGMEFRVNRWPLLREKIPLLLLGAALAGFTYWTQQHGGAVRMVAAAPPLKLLRVAEDYGFYLRKLFWPANLSILYPASKLVVAHASMVAAVLAGLTALALRWLFQFPWLATGWFWFLGTLVPVVGLVRIGHITVADRYMYLPSVGLAVGLAWAAGRLAERMPGTRRPVVVVCALALAACAATTYAGLPRWRNSVALFEAAIRLGDHDVAYDNLTTAYIVRGDYDDAIRTATKAIALYPNAPDPYSSRGLAYYHKGDHDRAIADFTASLRLKPEQAEVHNNRGTAHLGKGELDEAIRDFSDAIRIDPRHVSAWNNRGNARMLRGEYDQAIADCTRAIELNPRHADAFNNRANAWIRKGSFARALADYGQAIKLNPSSAIYYNNRAAAFCDLKQFARAETDLQKCRQLGGQPPAGLVQAIEAGLIAPPSAK